MLNYSEVAISPLEVPEELSICIYISGCQNHCKDCHYPELRRYDYGDPLLPNLSNIVDVYLQQATCVCFMGEGQERDRHQLIEANKYIKKRGLKTCLYSGRDVTIEEWMKVFNYIKIGSFQKDKGPLYSKKTNQRLYKLAGDDDKAEDITYLFW